MPVGHIVCHLQWAIVKRCPNQGWVFLSVIIFFNILSSIKKTNKLYQRRYMVAISVSCKKEFLLNQNLKKRNIVLVNESGFSFTFFTSLLALTCMIYDYTKSLAQTCQYFYVTIYTLQILSYDSAISTFAN